LANYKTNITAQTLRDVAMLTFVFGLAVGGLVGYIVKGFLG